MSKKEIELKNKVTKGTFPLSLSVDPQPLTYTTTFNSPPRTYRAAAGDENGFSNPLPPEEIHFPAFRKAKSQ